MASYGLDARFKDPHYCFRLTDPSAYSHIQTRKIKPNRYGFLSSAPRNTQCWRAPYTDKMYDARVDRKIPNATSLMSKTPRFSFEPFKEEQLDEILCTCDMEDPCVCPTVPVVCEAYVHKRVFKGPAPHSVIGEGISIPTKRDRGFEILHDGSARRLLDVVVEECPPFYDARVHYSPEFYRGCKWSNWRTPRMGAQNLEVRPGPADYTIEIEKSQYELCMEKVRAEKRKKSKQLRFIELVQERNIREGRAGPADYSPRMPKGTDLKFLGPKETRFPANKYEERPSPASYTLKSVFDSPELPTQPCRAKLPAPACFGIKAQRFKTRILEGPGPADYDTGVKLCNVLNCSEAPFGCSAKRFQEDKIDSDGDVNEDVEGEEEEMESCPKLTWQFRSRTKRFRAIKTEFDPYIPYIRKPIKERPIHIQEIAPFNNSQGRFQPWFDWLPLHVGLAPGPGQYNANKARCLPAVNHGPLYRDRRFKENIFLTPAPNEHIIEGGVGDVLKTHNKKLRENVMNHGKQFRWIPPPEPRHYSLIERELMILDRAIKQLEVEDERPLVVLKAESSVTIPGSKRVSRLDGERRADEREKFASADISEKRAIAEKGEPRVSIDSAQKHVTVDKGEKRVSADRSEERSTTDKGQKRSSADQRELRNSTVSTELHAGTQVLHLLPGAEPKSPDEEMPKKIDIVAPKQKMLRTFLYKQRMPVYF